MASTEIERLLNDDHREMRVMAEWMHSCIEQKRSGDLQSIVRALLDVITLHNSMEESLMRTHGYPGLDRHAKQHAEFEARLSELFLDLEKGEMVIMKPVVRFVEYWMEHHVSAEDGEFLHHLKSSSSSA